MTNRILIVGSSIAGLSAAEAARAKDPDCEITMLSEDSHMPYYRQRLREVLNDPARAEKLVMHPAWWYEDQGIDLRLNRKVKGLLPKEKVLMLEGGERLGYDRLILATGSASFVPPIKGADLPGVETMWTMADALRIEAQIAGARRSIVIGGGLLGLEAADALHRRGLESLILERLPRLMMRQLDERSAELFEARVEQEGTKVSTSALIREICAGPDGRAAGVLLQDGSRFEADLILISAGVRARTEYLAGSGVEADRFIRVDDHMRTNIEDIYAAGDCAAMNGRWYGLWPVAALEGAVAGENAAGGDRACVMKTPPYVVKTMGTQIASAGMVEEAELPREALEQLHKDVMENSALFEYAKKLYVGDTLSGFVLLGNTKAFSSLSRQLGE